MGYWLLLACHWLNQNGANIKLTLLSRNPELILKKHPELRGISWVNWITGDIKNYPWPHGNFDLFIHGATDTSPAAGLLPTLFDDITIGTQRMLAHAAKSGARRVMLISSGAVYGEQPNTLSHLSEEFSGLDSSLPEHDFYGRGKRVMEQLAQKELAHTEITIARCFSFIGFGLPQHLAISQFINHALCGNPITVTGDGRTNRSYLYAADMAIWLLTILIRGKDKRAYNVGAPNSNTMLNIATTVRDIIAPSSNVTIQAGNSETTRRSYIPSIQRISDELGVKVWTSTPSAIQRTAKANLIQGKMLG